MAASILGVKLMQVVGLALVMMALISTLIFYSAVKSKMELKVEESQVKAFKGEEPEVVVALESRGTGWTTPQVTYFRVGDAEVVKADELAERRIRLHLRGRYAGRSKGLTFELSFSDPLKLFLRVERLARTDFTLDILPLSLLAVVPPRRIPLFGFGEVPTGFPGGGQELYSLEEYHSSSDTKDIIWKRVAKSSHEALISRVRESNVKEALNVGVIQLLDRHDARAAWMDTLCEGLGTVGKEALAMGASVTILYQSRDGPVAEKASDVDGLAEAMMACSLVSASKDVGEVVRRSDLVVTGLRELEDQSVAQMLLGKPTLLISEDTTAPVLLDDRAMIYSGKESLFPLIRRALER